MCTLSWKPGPAGYRLWFNRDEQRTRPPATPPVLLKRNGVSCLAPFDGAGGTWLLVNTHGLTLALLNHYPAVPPAMPAAPHSRGLLPLACAGCASVREALACCASQALADYRPFHLAAASGQEAAVLTWDGHSHTAAWLPPQGGMLTSSGWRPESVAQSRHAAFASLVGPMAQAAPERLEAFHRHRGEEAAAGIRMARPDACTHSIARIDVSWLEGAAHFRYEPQMEIQPMPATTTSRLYLENPGHA